MHIAWSSFWLFCCALRSSCAALSTPNKTHTLYILSLAPYPHSTMPNDTLNPSWDGGFTLTPAARLAVQEINNRTDVLPDFQLELIEMDCGCDLTFKAVNSLIDSVFYTGKQVVGIVGPACSDSALVLAKLATQKSPNILQVSVATSPTLVKYPYALRTVSSSFEYVSIYISLVKRKEWKSLVLLYDTLNSLFEATYMEFKRQLQADTTLSDVKIAYESGITTTFLPVEAIMESNARVIFGFLGPVAVDLLCLAGKKGLRYDAYQFIFHDRSVYEFNTTLTVSDHGVNYYCSNTYMLSILSGHIFLLYHLNRTELNQSNAIQDVILVSNKSYSTFFSEYSAIKQQVLKEPGHLMYQVTDLTYGPPYYDAVWSLALALNRSVPVLNQQGTPLQYYWPFFNHTDAIDTILDQFYNPPLSFVGASGSISFRKATGDSATVIFIYQANGTVYMNNLVGSASDGNLTEIPDLTIFIADHFANKSTAIPLAGAVIVFFLDGIALFLTILFHIVNVVYQNHEYIKPTSPTLNHLVFSGCYLFILSCLLFTVPRTFEQQPLVQGVLFNGFVWSLVLGLAMVFGTVTVKMWRIYRIFVYFNNPGQLLSNHLLILFVIVLASIDTVVLTTWTSVDPLLAYQMKQPSSTSDMTLVWYRYACSHAAVWIAVVTLLNGTVILLLIIISIRARKVRSQYNHTKSINILIYILIALVTIGVGVYGILVYNQDANTVSTTLPPANTMMCLVLVGTVYLFIVFLFLPPWLPYLRKISFREVRTAPFTRDHN